ncbi:MAG: LacI family DNA-binding transcriptional regulator [Candidatus Hydrogenedentes bacterium]|nr:LacI family DNA-binding transcriptional regulator [Candidatus Hydrogenedentota bacterium]
MAPTLKDIAAAAEVSVSTASRALSGHPAINQATVERVHAVAEQMQYTPRRAARTTGIARGLATADIGVLSLGMDPSLVALPVIASALNGVEAELTASGARIQLAHIADLARPPRALDVARLHGVILMGAMQGGLVATQGGALLGRLQGRPVVWAIGRPCGCRGDAVVSNDYAVGAKAAEYLVERGHRRLAFLNPKPDHLLFMRREDGFTAAARRLGASVTAFCEAPAAGWELPLRPPLAVDTVQSLVDRLLEARPRRTAVFAAADSVATLVYRALSVRELRAGRDISVISANNDHSLIAGLHPRLTTFDIHAYEIGRMAVRRLAMRLLDRTPQPDCEVMVDTSVIEGESVCPVPGHRGPTTDSSLDTGEPQ